MKFQPRRLLPLLLALSFSFATALELTFLNVGQGTSVLIAAPGGQTALYDAGPAGADTAGQLRELGVTDLSLVIASHAHADHIGGLAAVISSFEPAFYMDNGVPHTTRTYERTLLAAADSGAQLLEPYRRTISLGEVQLLVVPPPQRNLRDHNNNSVGLRIEYGQFSAFLPGDAEEAQWDYWLSEHRDLLAPVDVHLSSHHGSRNGDTAAGVNSLDPDTVIISVGSGNRYEHPHQEALALYDRATLYRTDLHRRVTISVAADGTYLINAEYAPEQAASELLPSCSGYWWHGDPTDTTQVPLPTWNGTFLHGICTPR